MSEGWSRLSDEQLIEELVNAAARAGVSGSGLVIDVMHGAKYERLKSLKEEALRRLKRTTPVPEGG